jgi:hypothetical protein
MPQLHRCWLRMSRAVPKLKCRLLQFHRSPHHVTSLYRLKPTRTHTNPNATSPRRAQLIAPHGECGNDKYCLAALDSTCITLFRYSLLLNLRRIAMHPTTPPHCGRPPLAQLIAPHGECGNDKYCLAALDSICITLFRYSLLLTLRRIAMRPTTPNLGCSDNNPCEP